MLSSRVLNLLLRTKVLLAVPVGKGTIQTLSTEADRVNKWYWK